MNLDGSTLLVALLSLIQVAVAGVLLVTVWRLRHGSAPRLGTRRLSDATKSFEEHVALPVTLCVALLVTVLFAWPAHYLALAGLIPFVDGAFCTAGVTELGRGAPGLSGQLPLLVDALAWSKPAVLCSGIVAFALIQTQRFATSFAVLPILLVVLGVTGGLGVLDGVCELVYLTAPKDIALPSSGCCTVAAAPQLVLDGTSRTASAISSSASDVPALLGLLTFGLLLLGTLTTAGFASRPADLRVRLGGLALLGGAVLFLTLPLLTTHAAPVLLGLPFHGCGYCLIERLPEAALMHGGLAVGIFGVWAAFAAALAQRLEPAARFDSVVRGALLTAGFAFLTATTILVVELWLAPTLGPALSGVTG